MLKISKKVISNLTKCYSIAKLNYNDKEHLLVAAEKMDACLLFDLDGNKIDTVFEQPGGVMTMIQVPNSNGQFLSTQKFYSPNDSKEAKIVIVTPKIGGWEVRTLVDLPHIHRFDIINRNGINYLIACALKSGHEFKEDWTNPGKVYCAVLPDDLSVYNENNQLQFTVLKDGLTRNHGYYKIIEDGVETSLISSENGVFQFYPPKNIGEEWTIVQHLDTPSSDATMIDLDGDGEKEMLVLAPFHGNSICIYKKINGKYEKVYEYLNECIFVHAIWSGSLMGKNTIVIGCRGGERPLIAFTYENGEYKSSFIDKNCGPANVLKFDNKGKENIIATNREIDEIAIYTFD